MTTIQRLDALKIDLELQGLEVMHGQIEAIKTTHLAEIKALQPKPKRVIAKKPKEQPLKVEITEAGKTTEVIFQTEKECETFLKSKQKAQASRVNLFLSSAGLSIPNDKHYSGGWRDQKYRDARELHASKLKNAGLDFNVVITRP